MGLSIRRGSCFVESMTVLAPGVLLLRAPFHIVGSGSDVRVGCLASLVRLAVEDLKSSYFN